MTPEEVVKYLYKHNLSPFEAATLWVESRDSAKEDRVILNYPLLYRHSKHMEIYDIVTEPSRPWWKVW